MNDMWWPIGDAGTVLGEPGTELIRWLRETISVPEPGLGRSGPMCPYVPATMRRELIFGVTAEPTMDAREFLREQASLFVRVEPLVPAKDAILKTVLVVFPDRDGAELTAAVAAIKQELIAAGLTCGEFYPASDDRSARSATIRVARSPMPLVALRYLTPHDHLFLSTNPQYGRIFAEWLTKSGHPGESAVGARQLPGPDGPIEPR